ncbi:DUF4177 domain-containing protein [Nocardiopsis sp. CNT-189]|uniref:DUF4177 domain-containing protein n=1 Tax=Nocardiopsis oceanisediminis TaxID=2816862 RepID=UPI003B311714
MATGREHRVPACSLRMKGFGHEQTQRGRNGLGGQGRETAGAIAPGRGRRSGSAPS